MDLTKNKLTLEFCYLTKVSILISRATIVATKSISNDVHPVCGPALAILDEVRQSNPMNSLDDYCDP
jgi:hypothetical protein